MVFSHQLHRVLLPRRGVPAAPVRAPRPPTHSPCRPPGVLESWKTAAARLLLRGGGASRRLPYSPGSPLPCLAYQAGRGCQPHGACGLSGAAARRRQAVSEAEAGGGLRQAAPTQRERRACSPSTTPRAALAHPHAVSGERAFLRTRCAWAISGINFLRTGEADRPRAARRLAAGARRRRAPEQRLPGAARAQKVIICHRTVSASASAHRVDGNVEGPGRGLVNGPTS